MKFISRLFRKPEAIEKAKPKKYVLEMPREIKPVRGIDPKAQAKLILERGALAKVVILTDGQDSHHLLEDRGDYWLVDAEVRREVLVK